MYFECSGPFLRCCLNCRFPTSIGDTPENADIERLPQVLGPNSTHRGFRLNTLGVFFLNIFPTPTRRWSLNHHLGSMKPEIDAEKDGYDTLNAELSSSKFFLFQQGSAFKKQKYKITPPQRNSQLSEKLLPTLWKNHPNLPFPSTAEVFFNSISNPHPATHSLTPPPLWSFLVSPSPLDFVGPSENSARNNLVTIAIRRQKKYLRKTLGRKKRFLGGQKNKSHQYLRFPENSAKLPAFSVSIFLLVGFCGEKGWVQSFLWLKFMWFAQGVFSWVFRSNIFLVIWVSKRCTPNSHVLNFWV